VLVGSRDLAIIEAFEQRYADVAASGRDFAARWHDGRAAAESLSGFLGA